MRTLLTALLIAAPTALEARATDWIVDPSGAASPFTNVTQAMTAAVPGDRIFVMPGNYPAFHFSRGVEVIGLGHSPSEVVIARVDFHPNAPITGFDAGLANLTVCGGAPEDAISISGNELASGTLVLQGVVTCGGVYLRGAGSFYLLCADSRFQPTPGAGFLNSAFDFGGGTADFVDTRIEGSPASLAASQPAGIGLRIGGGAIVRLSHMQVQGGVGASSGLSALQHGADAIAKGFGAAMPDLRLSGGSVIAGGNAGPGGVGGDGVEMSALISVGQATVGGGSGAVAGLDFAGSQPTLLGYDPYLRAQPAKLFASGDAFYRPGTQVVVSPGAVLPGIGLGYALRIDPPSNPVQSPLPSEGTLNVAGSQFVVNVTASQFSPWMRDAFARRRVYVQGCFRPFEDAPLVATNPVPLMLARN